MKNVVKDNSTAYLQINGSKFYAYGFNLTNIKEVEPIIKDLWTKNKKAVHICYGFITNSITKFDDDNEPKGLAGKKILLSLQNNNFTNSLIVVVRYKSRSMLGAGLLSRSYYKVSELLLQNESNYTKLKEMVRLSFNITSKKDISWILDLAKEEKVVIIENKLNSFVIDIELDFLDTFRQRIKLL